MINRRAVCKLAVVFLAAAVAVAGAGSGDQKGGPSTTPSEKPAATAKAPDKPAPPTVSTPPEKPVGVAPVPAGDFEAFAKKQEVPCARVPQVTPAPTIDGDMDEIYKKATPLKFGFLSGGEGKPTAATTVYCVSADKDLYVFFNCESPDMDALMAEVREHDGQVWNDDSIEIFIDPTNKRQVDGYMHIAANALGTTAEFKGAKGAEDDSWNPKLKVKAKTGKKGWTIELAIPLADLVADPAKLNRVWAVNFNRMAHLFQGPEDTAWSATQGTDSHVPDKFGCLWLDAATVDNAKK